ncbi:hypothetical protein G6F68_021148 [Rhizopus microsporus]|nr:hypothetical protein G6F68_021148 [Rhizopus microsporus]
MQQIALAVIGGTGVYNLAKLDDVQTHEVDTRFGRPSGPVRVGTLLGHRVAFLARHAAGRAAGAGIEHGWWHPRTLWSARAGLPGPDL